MVEIRNLYNQKTNSPAFSSRVTPEIVTSGHLLREFINNGYQSATGLRDIRYPANKFKNDLHRALFVLKSAELDSLIDLYRNFFDSVLHFNSKKQWWTTQKKIINEIKAVNCSECADFAYFALLKKGIPSRIVYDEFIDHSFVVANREEPFHHYKSDEKENFVVDFWTKNIYPTVQAAFLDYKRRFGAGMCPYLQDLTKEPCYNKIPNKMTKEENSLKNETRLALLKEAADYIKTCSSRLRLGLLQHEYLYKNKSSNCLEMEFKDIFTAFLGI